MTEAEVLNRTNYIARRRARGDVTLMESKRQATTESAVFQADRSEIKERSASQPAPRAGLFTASARRRDGGGLLGRFPLLPTR